ncbi:MAG: NAD(P)H-dependent oxidoreductase, partial [Rhizobiales bacterium]|nr:NAD(P)H-dependent oxidoreductase [Hyphomicrobiales bacterium]
MSKLNVAVLVGSTRRDSLNRRLAEALGRLAGERLAFTFVKIDDLPLYNQDLEADYPESAKRVKAEIEAADGVLFVTPEHSRSIPAALKNAIDWAARPWGKNSWAGKPAAITGTSPGAVGTAVAQAHLRHIASILGMIVTGGEAYISFRPDLIDAQGNVTDESTRAFLQTFIDQFATLLEHLHAGRKALAR